MCLRSSWNVRRTFSKGALAGSLLLVDSGGPPVPPSTNVASEAPVVTDAPPTLVKIAVIGDTFPPEKLTAYEVGSKNEFAGGKAEGAELVLGSGQFIPGFEEQLVGAIPHLRHLAVDERVGEAGDVAGGFPDLGVHDDGRFDADDVVATVNHVAPPALADVALKFHAQRAIVEETVQAAVDFGGRVDKAPALCERDEGLH